MHVTPIEFAAPFVLWYQHSDYITTIFRLTVENRLPLVEASDFCYHHNLLGSGRRTEFRVFILQVAVVRYYMQGIFLDK